MGKRRKRERQEDLWIPSSSIVATPGHAFYERLEELLRRNRFDALVEPLCQRYYRGPAGRPSITPGAYFRMMLIGYFEGLDSERGIAWRVADSLSLRKFLGYGLNEKTPDHSTISRTRRLYWLSTHKAVFAWVLRIVEAEGLLRGKTIGIDGTTLEANAAMRSIVRRDTEQGYEAYVRKLAAEAGLEEPTREQLARFDRKRKKKASNEDWKSPHDPDARITKMKDGRTHLAHKAEHAVDLSSGAIVAVTLQPADRGDTTSIFETLDAAQEMAASVGVKIEELVLDKGYHSNDVLVGLYGDSIRSYISEPERGRRRWYGKDLEQELVHGNRRRLRGDRSKSLHKKRAELGERSFAHMYETGGMRRLHLRGCDNALKRILIHGAAFNLGIVMRKMLGVGTPRRLKDLLAHILVFIRAYFAPWRQLHALLATIDSFHALFELPLSRAGQTFSPLETSA